MNQCRLMGFSVGRLGRGLDGEAVRVCDLYVFGIRRASVFVSVPGATTFAKFVKLPPVEPKRIPEDPCDFEAIHEYRFRWTRCTWDLSDI